jgi:hypothetical protein
MQYQFHLMEDILVGLLYKLNCYEIMNVLTNNDNDIVYRV